VDVRRQHGFTLVELLVVIRHGTTGGVAYVDGHADRVQPAALLVPEAWGLDWSTP
jgi:prepilin-type processing-associated H-X9-DG protein